MKITALDAKRGNILRLRQQGALGVLAEKTLSNYKVKVNAQLAAITSTSGEQKWKCA